MKEENVFIFINNICTPGGTERAVVNLANLLNQTLHFGVTIISAVSTSGTSYYAVDEGVDIIHLDLGTCSKKRALKWYFQFVKKGRKLLKQHRPAYILGTAHGINFFLPLINNEKKAKTVGCEHMIYNLAPKPAQLMRKIAYKKLDHLVVLTETDKQQYTFLDNVSVIPNSLSFYPDQPSELDQKQILAIGWLLPVKGFDMLLRAAALLAPKFPDWHLKIIGNGPLESDLKNQITQSGLGNFVTIAPPTREIEREYFTSSLYVMSSRSEGFGMVLVEAQAYGLPTVSFDCPIGPREIINDNRDGFLVENGNTVQMAEKLELLIRDPELRATFSKNARENVKRFSSEHIKGQWLDLFRKLKASR